jgi:hypothetical protein
MGKKKHDFEVHLYVYAEGTVFTLIQRDYRPNGTMCNASLIRQQILPHDASPFDVAACLYDFLFDLGVLRTVSRAL